MSAKGPLELAVQIAVILERLKVDYALGGSLASSLVGEPRSTIDVDMAAKLDSSTIELFLDGVPNNFYIPRESAYSAINTYSSFNLIDIKNSLKIDIFVVGDDLLDRLQIEHRVLVKVPGTKDGIWVTSPEDQILRKLHWYTLSEKSLERQVSDIKGILSINKEDLDLQYINENAKKLGLFDTLSEIIEEE